MKNAQCGELKWRRTSQWRFANSKFFKTSNQSSQRTNSEESNQPESSLKGLRAATFVKKKLSNKDYIHFGLKRQRIMIWKQVDMESNSSRSQWNSIKNRITWNKFSNGKKKWNFIINRLTWVNLNSKEDKWNSIKNRWTWNNSNNRRNK